VFPSEFGDDSSTLDNTYDAIVFQTHRIGHGLGFFKQPKLYPYLKERSIAFEICPASNQILGIGFLYVFIQFFKIKNIYTLLK
jgi:hypothetical protein